MYLHHEVLGDGTRRDQEPLLHGYRAVQDTPVVGSDDAPRSALGVPELHKFL